MKFTEDNLELCNRKSYYFQLESLVLGSHKIVVCKLSCIRSCGFDIFLSDGKVREEQYGKGKEKEFKFDGFPFCSIIVPVCSKDLLLGYGFLILLLFRHNF